MLSFCMGFGFGVGCACFTLLVFALCATSKRADEAAEKAERKTETVRKAPVSIMVRGDESVVN